MVAREGIAPPTCLCRRDMILFHRRAEIGCGRRIRTIDFAFKERRVACYSIPHWDWPAIRSSEPERGQPSVAGRLWRASFTLTQPDAGSVQRMVEPEVVATSPNRIKSPVPVYCGFSSENGGRERTCTSKARRLSICGVCYSLLTTRPINTQ